MPLTEYGRRRVYVTSPYVLAKIAHFDRMAVFRNWDMIDWNALVAPRLTGLLWSVRHLRGQR